MLDINSLLFARNFFCDAERDYILAKNNNQRQVIIRRIQGYLQSNPELTILLNEGCASGLFRSGYIDSDFGNVTRIINQKIKSFE